MIGELQHYNKIVQQAHSGDHYYDNNKKHFQ